MATVQTGESIDELLYGTGTGIEVLATGVAGGGVATPASQRAAAAYRLDLAAVLDAEGVRGTAGEVVRVPVRPPPDRPELPTRWLLVGTGAGTAPDLRRAGAAVGRAVGGRARIAADLLPPGRGRAGADLSRALVEGLLLTGYTPAVRPGTPRELERVVLLGARHAPDAVAVGELHARTGSWSRELALTPSSVKSPAWMVEQARAAAERAALAIEVWDVERLSAEGFGGLVAVGGGSATPPYLVRLDYRPDRAGTGRPVVLVGKGITFDTGGISLKPREAMVAMKTDMSGAAAVLATMAACAEAGVRREVIGLLPLAENMPGAAAYRPGDVVRHYGGRTVEVANTDAEGRMVLADALAYADARLDPDQLVDVATLTGAAAQGLGRRHAALYTADDALARALEAAGEASGELLWRMPLVADYQRALHSHLADLRNVPAPPSIGGGSITAALFLRAFVGARRWAHLDIAGPARSDKEEHHVPKGATGFGARLLLRWLEGLG